MTTKRRLRDHHRLNLERARDALFEARVMLSELERDHSISLSVQRSLAEEINHLELNQLLNVLDQALLLRNRIRAHHL